MLLILREALYGMIGFEKLGELEGSWFAVGVKLFFNGGGVEEQEDEKRKSLRSR